MSDMRDYYLQNLGIGEIWKCKDADHSLKNADMVAPSIDVLHHAIEVSTEKSLAPVRAQAQDSSPSTLRDLSLQIRNCTQCACCARFGRAQLSPAPETLDVLIVTEFGAPVQVDAQEKLIENILAALPFEKSIAIHRSAVLKAQAPQSPPLSQSSKKDFDLDAANTCLPFLQQEILLLRPRWIFIFGAPAANVLLAPVTPSDVLNLRQNPAYYHDIPVIVTHSIDVILAQPELKREVWADICQLKKLVA